MLYYAAPHAPSTPTSCSSPGVIAAQVAFAVERTTAEEQARRSEERLRFALDAASMGTWDWDLATQRRAVVRQPRSGFTACPPAPSTARSPATSARSIPTIATRVFASVQRALPKACRTTSSTASSRPTARCAGAKGRGASSTQDGQPVADDRRLHDGHAAEGGGARAAGGRRGSEPPEGRVPRDAVARTAHAAERDPRLGADAAAAARCRPSAPAQAIDVIEPQRAGCRRS